MSTFHVFTCSLPFRLVLFVYALCKASLSVWKGYVNLNYYYYYYYYMNTFTSRLELAGC